MKKIRLIAVLLFAISVTFSACKKDAEETIECLTERALVSISHSVDAENPKLITFKVTYSGDHTLDHSINWNFGDSKSPISNTVEKKHTYSEAGTYHAKAEVTIRNGDAWCTYELDETVEVN